MVVFVKVFLIPHCTQENGGSCPIPYAKEEEKVSVQLIFGVIFSVNSCYILEAATDTLWPLVFNFHFYESSSHKRTGGYLSCRKMYRSMVAISNCALLCQFVSVMRLLI